MCWRIGSVEGARGHSTSFVRPTRRQRRVRFAPEPYLHHHFQPITLPMSPETVTLSTRCTSGQNTSASTTTSTPLHDASKRSSDATPASVSSTRPSVTTTSPNPSCTRTWWCTGIFSNRLFGSCRTSESLKV